MTTKQKLKSLLFLICFIICIVLYSATTNNTASEIAKANTTEAAAPNHTTPKIYLNSH